jgi:hypothetical protein
MELDPGYAETSLRRFEGQFCIEAIHEATGLTLDELIAQRREEATRRGQQLPRRIRKPVEA